MLPWKLASVRVHTALFAGLLAASVTFSAAGGTGLLDMQPPYFGDQAASKPAQVGEKTQPAEVAAPVEASYLLSPNRMHSDPQILWPGFLTGMRGFEHFYEPVGNPLYFESPFVNSSLRALYLHHDFPDDSNLGGGDASIYAAQIRVALTERLGFIATKDGWTALHARALPSAAGWNDFAIGAKYAFIMNREWDFVMTGGLRWEWANGDADILQGGDQELSPFISFAKGFDKFHVLGNLTARFPTDKHDGNKILSWDLHADYEVAPQALPGFAPMVEIHGLHYISNGDRLPLDVGGLDYSNIGSKYVSGDGVIWAGLGFRWKFTPHVSLGSTWEFPLHNPGNDIMGNRATVDMMLTW